MKRVNSSLYNKMRRRAYSSSAALYLVRTRRRCTCCVRPDNGPDVALSSARWGHSRSSTTTVFTWSCVTSY